MHRPLHSETFSAGWSGFQEGNSNHSFGAKYQPNHNMKILIATDFSKCANNALRYGLEVAAKMGASVGLLHVVPPLEAVDNNLYQALWMDDYIKVREAELAKLMAEMLKKTQFPSSSIQAWVKIGLPVQQICQTAKDEQADLIIMGATGASDLESLSLGSKTSGVLGHTRIPVLAIPAKSQFQTTAIAVFPTDFNIKIGQRSLVTLKALLAAHVANLTVLNIFGLGNHPNPREEEKVSKKLGDTPHHFQYLHDTNIPQAVSNFMEAFNANLMVTISHDHSLLHRFFYESTSIALAFRIRAPTLVLHDA